MKYILFDLDGTLSEPYEGITKSVQYALEKRSIYVNDPQELSEFIGPPLTDIFCEKYGMTPEEAREALEDYRVRFNREGIYENHPYDGIESMLKNLSRFATLAVASSKPEPMVKVILDRYGFSKYFSVITGSNLDGTREKKSEVIAEALKRLNIENSSDVIMVGDRKYDIEGAELNCIKCIAVNYGYAKEGEFASWKPYRIVDTVKELEFYLSMFALR